MCEVVTTASFTQPKDFVCPKPNYLVNATYGSSSSLDFENYVYVPSDTGVYIARLESDTKNEWVVVSDTFVSNYPLSGSHDENCNWVAGVYSEPNPNCQV